MPDPLQTFQQELQLTVKIIFLNVRAEV